MSKPVHKLLIFFTAISGLAAMTATRVAGISMIPGFHYDEAWAANFAYRIASEPGFWPLTAMSPYTSPWGHYWTAAFFKVLGPSLLIYRSSGIALVILGIALVCTALARFGERRVAALLPWLLAFTPVLVANDRFSVDITSVHVFTLGLLALGSSLPYPAAAFAIAAAVLIGVTSHVLFIGVALAALFSLLFTSPPEPIFKTVRIAACIAGVGCIAFFIRIYFLIPERDKALALMVLTLFSVSLIAFPALSRLVRARLARPNYRTGLNALIALLLTPAGFLLIFSFEGSWSLRFFTGEISAPFLIGSFLLAPVGIFFLTGRSRRDIPKIFTYFITLTAISTASLAVKPAPRYFEIPIILTVVYLAMLVLKLPRRVGFFLISLWLITGAVQLGFNYYAPLASSASAPKDVDYRFLFFHENTQDTLNKQKLVAYLGAQGCLFEQVTTRDPRLSAELRFLAHSDWPVAGAASHCAWGKHPHVERLTQAPAQTSSATPFWITGE